MSAAAGITLSAVGLVLIFLLDAWEEYKERRR